VKSHLKARLAILRFAALASTPKGDIGPTIYVGGGLGAPPFMWVEAREGWGLSPSLLFAKSKVGGSG
jgi:hypothetical protein